MTNPVKNCRWIKYPLGDITQYYGENPKLYEPMGIKGHNGIDIVRPYGEHLFAVEGGVVCDLKEDPDGYGRHIRILTKDYHEWTYGHLSEIAVKLGQEVKEGQFVGRMGNSGFVVSGNTPYWGTNPYAGTHLHLTLRLMEKDPNGWQYPYAGSPRVKCLNYSNGLKGAVDPIPFFFDSPKARQWRAIAEAYKSSVLYDLSVILQKIHI